MTTDTSMATTATFTITGTGRRATIAYPDGRYLNVRSRTEAEHVARLLLAFHTRRAEKNDESRTTAYPLKITRPGTDYKIARGDFHLNVRPGELLTLANRLVDIAEGTAAPEEPNA